MTAKSYPVQRHVPVTFNMEVPPPPPGGQSMYLPRTHEIIFNLFELIDSVTVYNKLHISINDLLNKITRTNWRAWSRGHVTSYPRHDDPLDIGHDVVPLVTVERCVVGHQVLQVAGLDVGQRAAWSDGRLVVRYVVYHLLTCMQREYAWVLKFEYFIV